MIQKFLLILGLCLISLNSFSQSEWENVSSTHFKWGHNDAVKISSSSLSYLSFWNYNAESAANKKSNKWSYESIEMDISWIEKRSWRITFNITNNNSSYYNKYNVVDASGKETWHTNNIYWGYKIFVNDSSYDVQSFEKYYCSLKKSNYRGTYIDTWIDNSHSWVDASSDKIRTVSIEYDGNGNIKVRADGSVVHTFKNATSILAIAICAGSAADVRVSNFKVERKTLYADVKPFISSGDSKLDQKNYWEAISDYSVVIEKGYESYDIYYHRALAYYAMEFYNNAIDDFTKALSYKKTENAYLFRGLSKLAKEDISAIEDLKLGGSKGLALVKELDIKDAPKPNNANNSKYIASGSGFFIDPRGYIATNAHVIENAKGIDILVSIDGKTLAYTAQRVIVDKTNDLAIIKISDSRFNVFSSIPYSWTNGTREVGTDIFAMGYPQLSYLGEEIKVTDGIISSKTGYQGDITTYQISAPIQPGNSGGPLFDKNGNLLGITSSGVTALDNVGYAIKVSYLNNLIEACPDVLQTPSSNELNNLSFTEKIKKISPYVVIIKIY